MIQGHYIYYALYFYYYYISSTSDHQALDPGGWGPCSNAVFALELLVRLAKTWSDLPPGLTAFPAQFGFCPFPFTAVTCPKTARPFPVSICFPEPQLTHTHTRYLFQLGVKSCSFPRPWKKLCTVEMIRSLKIRCNSPIKPS